MYTNVYQRGNYLYVRGVENGRKVQRKVDFRPTLWTSGRNSKATDKWTTLDGQTVYAFQPGYINDCREYIESYGQVHGINIYESPGHVYQYIAENYPQEINWDSNDVTVYTIDIETETEYGFPDPATANEKIILITIKDTRHNKLITWGVGPFTTERSDVEYREFQTEQSMLKDFIAWWQQNYPDAITGWNSSLFDVTYMYNRLAKVLSDSLANKMSPWGQVYQREVDLGGRTAQKTYIAGISSLDYLDLYKKFTYSAQESYKLDYIAWAELGERKLENPTGTGQFKAFYSGEFDVANKPLEDAHEIEKKGYLRTQMKMELERRGLLPAKT